jgi:hypothetical protein
LKGKQQEEPPMTISIKQSKELQQLGKHEVSAELCLQGYQLSAMGIVEGIDFFAAHRPSHFLRGLQVHTSLARSNGFGDIGEYCVSKKYIEESCVDLWFAFVLVLPEGFCFVVVPRRELLRFLQRKERLQPCDSNALRFELFFDANGQVSSCGHVFTPFLGLDRLFPAVRLAA